MPKTTEINVEGAVDSPVEGAVGACAAGGAAACTCVLLKALGDSSSCFSLAQLPKCICAVLLERQSSMAQGQSEDV